MQAFSEQSNSVDMPLQLLLFVDKRPSSKERIQQVQATLKELRVGYPFELEIIDVGEQPYLAEHFRLVATPALIKIHPEPRQTLAGTDLVAQLKHWWPYWQRLVEDYLASPSYYQSSSDDGFGETSQLDAARPSKATSPLPTSSEVEPPTILRGSSKEEAALKEIKPGRSHFTSSIAHSAELIQLSDEIFRLKQENEELAHQLRFKDQIISMLAHDLRNPLTAASIALETLEMGHSTEEGWSSRLTSSLIAQLLKHARTQTRAIDRMITDILQAARGTSSELRIQPQKLNLGNLLLEVLNDLQDRFDNKSLFVERDIPSDLPSVLADGERVRQVLTNLLDNAIKYTPVNGTIQVSVLHRTTQKVQVSICDNGPGVPEENRERIFEDHYRLKRDEEKEGYGIGLSLCQRIIRSHYGQIWVDSSPHQGSCFHFTLPVFRS